MVVVVPELLPVAAIMIDCHPGVVKELIRLLVTLLLDVASSVEVSVGVLAVDGKVHVTPVTVSPQQALPKIRFTPGHVK